MTTVKQAKQIKQGEMTEKITNKEEAIKECREFWEAVFQSRPRTRQNSIRNIHNNEHNRLQLLT